MNNVGKWVSVSISDGLIFEGTVEDETTYGIYINIGGNPTRLSMFPWQNVLRVVYTQVN
tara:strand:- start:3480 stop:3656 length:177 start_codon:yes stop_codon:yes gene_type:complete